jgi:geranylgeranyl reductase family protein
VTEPQRAATGDVERDVNGDVERDVNGDVERDVNGDVERDVDVAVVGAGPAGSAAALAVLAARPGARVALLDRADFPRDKSCGDGVAPQVLDVLARLGVHGILDDWPTVDALELGYPGGPWLTGRAARPNWVVPRRVLDARLVAAAVDRGAVLRRSRVRDLRRDGDLLLAGAVRARVVIGADGARSEVRAWLAPAGGGHTAIAIRGYAPVSAGREHAQVIAFDPQGAWPAYAWSFPVGDGSANVGYGEVLDANTSRTPTRGHLLERLDALLPGASDGAGDWRGHHLPLSTGRWEQPDGPVLLAGDALGLVNPLTGEGIHAAVLSGALAGLSAAASLRLGDPASAGARYRAALRARFGRHQRHMALLARATRTVTDKGGRGRALVDAALAAAQRDQRVFDDLAELGLSEGPLTGRVVSGLLRQLARERSAGGSRRASA